MECDHGLRHLLQLQGAHSFGDSDDRSWSADHDRAPLLDRRDGAGELDLDALHRELDRGRGQGERLGAHPGARLPDVGAEEVADRGPLHGEPGDLGVQGELRAGLLDRRQQPVADGDAGPGEHRPRAGDRGGVRRIEVDGVLGLTWDPDAEPRPVRPRHADLGPAVLLGLLRRVKDDDRRRAGRVIQGGRVRPAAAGGHVDQPVVRGGGAEDRGLPTQHDDPEVARVRDPLVPDPPGPCGRCPEGVHPADPGGGEGGVRKDGGELSERPVRLAPAPSRSLPRIRMASPTVRSLRMPSTYAWVSPGRSSWVTRERAGMAFHGGRASRSRPVS